jgi:hypothetical protein
VCVLYCFSKNVEFHDFHSATMKSQASHFMPLCKTWRGRSYVYSVWCNKHNDGKWSPFWCDSQWFVFLSSKLLGLYVWVSSIQHHRIIFFASIRVLTESQYTEWSKSYDWCWPRTYIVKCILCVLMVAWVWNEISFDPEQNKLCFIQYPTVGVDTFHIKY